jgi:hypothetical protein
MQNSRRTSGELNSKDEELWNAWLSSNARARDTNSLLADGCSREGASTHADFDFRVNTQRLRERQTSPEDEIEMFELNNYEMKLWSLWSTSNTRTNHITFLIIIGFSPEVAIGQAYPGFKAHYSGFGDAPQDEIVAFERHSCEKMLKSTWKSSKVREKHIKCLLANKFTAGGAIRQADIDFDDHVQVLVKIDISPEAKIGVFE